MQPCLLLEIGEMAISAFVGLVGQETRTFFLLDRLLSSFNLHTNAPIWPRIPTLTFNTSSFIIIMSDQHTVILRSDHYINSSRVSRRKHFVFSLFSTSLLLHFNRSALSTDPDRHSVSITHFNPDLHPYIEVSNKIKRKHFRCNSPSHLSPLFNHASVQRFAIHC